MLPDQPSSSVLMPPQKYSMSGPFLAAAAASKAGTRLSVLCSVVVILMFGLAASYFLIESATKPLRPAASWSPHHHIVSVVVAFAFECCAESAVAAPAVTRHRHAVTAATRPHRPLRTTKAPLSGWMPTSAERADDRTRAPACPRRA